METPKYTPQQAAELVADLWIEQIQKPLNKDNGDDNPLLFMLSAMNTMTAQQSISTESITRFKRALVTAVVEKLSQERCRDWFVLSSDYAPDHILTEAAMEAGIDRGAFPWKSRTTINLQEGKITYAFGYGKPHQTLELAQRQ